jgi:hypothetical protein
MERAPSTAGREVLTLYGSEIGGIGSAIALGVKEYPNFYSLLPVAECRVAKYRNLSVAEPAQGVAACAAVAVNT